MLAIDTNVVVRLIVNDDAKQASIARALIEKETVFVSLTVLLETAWVLQSAYGYVSTEVVRFLRAFSGIPTVTVEDHVALDAAFEWIEKGMGIADAFHLIASRDCAGFATFDRAFVKRAADVCDISVRAL